MLHSHLSVKQFAHSFVPLFAIAATALVAFFLPTTAYAQTNPDLEAQLIDISQTSPTEFVVTLYNRNIGTAPTGNGWNYQLLIDQSCDGSYDDVLSYTTSGGSLAVSGDRYDAAAVTIPAVGTTTTHCLAYDVNHNMMFTEESMFNNVSARDLSFFQEPSISTSSPSDPPVIEYFAARVPSQHANWEKGSVHAQDGDQIEVTWTAQNATECDLRANESPQDSYVDGTFEATDTVSYTAQYHGAPQFALNDYRVSITCTGPGGSITSKELYVGVYNIANPIAQPDIKVSVNGGPFQDEVYLSPSDSYEFRWDTNLNYTPTHGDPICTFRNGLREGQSFRDLQRYCADWSGAVCNNNGVEYYGMNQDWNGHVLDFGLLGTMSGNATNTPSNSDSPVTNRFKPIGQDDINEGKRVLVWECHNYESSTWREATALDSIELFIIPDNAEPPVITFRGQVAGDTSWSEGSMSVTSLDELHLQWLTENATECTGTNFDDLGNSPNNIQEDVPEPALNDSTVYSIECTGPGGTSVAALNVANNTGTFPLDDPGGPGGPPTGPSGSGNVDLTPTAVSLTGSRESYADEISGTYSGLPVNIVFRNDGPDDLPTDPISYVALLDVDTVVKASTSYTDVETPVETFGTGLNAGNSSPSLSSTLPQVPFGTHELCGQINTRTPIFPESDLSNNELCTTVDLDVPPPPMTLTTDRTLIRSGQSAELEYFVNVTYELQCEVVGSTITPSTPGAQFTTPDELDGTVVTGTIDNTSIFELTCREPITGTDFTQELVVEVIPEFQEI